ncbi:TDT family transporter [Loigolactobacillus jiayinensis]|uniref:TDT family transporter n=1 Tax=Loigolactobacillus jiayinensis TaxID=2486016 RepID=A0ABW1RAG2_9LACO|nr:TDT family transporter [Loigolactobacillus jiayinensis]
MSRFLKSIPLPICGLILAIVSLGNLFKDYQHLIIGDFLGAIGTVLIIIIVLKIISAPQTTLTDLQDPIIASVAPNLPMALLVTATFFTAYPLLANSIWYIGVGLQYGLLIYFTWHFVSNRHLKLAQIYPSWFIVYVGIGVIPLTAANFNPLVGQITFWLALSAYLVLLPLVLWRVLFMHQMPEATLPLITVIAAPGSLCLAGYLRDFAHPQAGLLLALVILAQSAYLLVLFLMPRLAQVPFYPSYAAFTFPLVISALAMTYLVDYLQKGGQHVIWLQMAARGESLIALVVVGCISLRYLRYLWRQNEPMTQKRMTKKSSD